MSTYEYNTFHCGAETISCAPYSVVKTLSAQVNYGLCLIYACPGTTITASLCGGSQSCVGDSYLSLRTSGSPFAEVVQDNDDSCDLCSEVSYSFPVDTINRCTTFGLHEGCFNQTACSGQVLVTGIG